jgi:hypothetical protein
MHISPRRTCSSCTATSAWPFSRPVKSKGVHTLYSSADPVGPWKS